MVLSNNALTTTPAFMTETTQKSSVVDLQQALSGLFTSVHPNDEENTGGKF
jgi:hypothetical protein